VSLIPIGPQPAAPAGPVLKWACVSRPGPMSVAVATRYLLGEVIGTELWRPVAEVIQRGPGELWHWTADAPDFSYAQGAADSLALAQLAAERVALPDGTPGLGIVGAGSPACLYECGLCGELRSFADHTPSSTGDGRQICPDCEDDDQDL
jgi:hypothetical protein